MRAYFVYILTNTPRGVLYVGVTRDLQRRVELHKVGRYSSFTRQWGTHRLVWQETHHDILAAIEREKTIKRWRRAWKFALVERDNPQWRDLFDESIG